MIRIALCDDEERFVRLLAGKLAPLFEPREVELRTFLSGAALRNEILAGRGFDVIFLDINLPDANGILLAKHLRPLIAESLLIFVSSQDEAVYESFTASPFRFLRKHRLEEELGQVVRDICRELERAQAGGILLQYRQSQISVNPNRVLYIESSGKVQILHMPERSIEVNYRLKELEPLFLPHGFVKPHNSSLVNYRCISSIGKTEVTLDSGERIPISKHRLAELKTAFLKLISEG